MKSATTRLAVPPVLQEVSFRRGPGARRLDDLTSVLQPGDRLVGSELSRLGRSLGQIVTILDALAKGRASRSWRSRRTSVDRSRRALLRGAW